MEKRPPILAHIIRVSLTVQNHHLNSVKVAELDVPDDFRTLMDGLIKLEKRFYFPATRNYRSIMYKDRAKNQNPTLASSLLCL